VDTSQANVLYISSPIQHVSFIRLILLLIASILFIRVLLLLLLFGFSYLYGLIYISEFYLVIAVLINYTVFFH
jgi:hypothetical protein